MIVVDPLLPLRPLRRGNRKQPLTGLQMLEKKGHERLVVPGTLDLERYPALDRIGKTMKLDDQEELLWKLTARVQELAAALVAIGMLLVDPECDDARFRRLVGHIIVNDDSQTKVPGYGIELLAKRVEGTCTNN